MNFSVQRLQVLGCAMTGGVGGGEKVHVRESALRLITRFLSLGCKECVYVCVRARRESKRNHTRDLPCSTTTPYTCT